MKAPRRHPLTIVAAVARNGVIGAAGRLPWHLPGDLAQFRRLTSGHPLVMGRVTYESIGHPLPGRDTTVVSRTPGFAPPGVDVAADLEAALATADRQADHRGAATIMVVGGAMIYAATLPMAQRLCITEVDGDPEGDATFPPIDRRIWRKVSEIEPAPDPKDERRYRFAAWERR